MTTLASSKSLVPLVPPIFKKILSIFPEQHFKYCFAYGSGVFTQGKASGPNPMIDLIFSVDDSASFHEQNISLNPSHYSAVKHLGPSFIAALQEKWPAGVYFNTLVPLKEESIVIKYGVVKNSDLIRDLLDWNYLYLAGRLQKPVLELMPPQEDLKIALKKNLVSAVHASLLIMPDCFTERQLYTVITALSYSGDFRMVVGEDKNKIYNIVDNQFDFFRALYQPILESCAEYLEICEGESSDPVCVQDMSEEVRRHHLFLLPKVPQQLLARQYRKFTRKHGMDTEDVFAELARDLDITPTLSTCLSSIVFSSSYKQSLKGILTAGFRKSLAYSQRKLEKMKKSEKIKRLEDL